MTDESIFACALAIGSPTDRAAYLDRSCAGKPDLRKEVEGLLSAHANSNPLDRPPRDLARTGAYEPDGEEVLAATVGDRIGPYRLMEQIGEGGFGLVFVAEQSEPVRRKVALKVLKPGMDTRDVVARFEAERQALALMDHPNIARVFDGGSTGTGRPYFVMELVRGVLITDYCDQHKLPPRERLALFVQVCQAVQHAHQKGVIHRDLKPSNILVTVVDGVPIPKVIDFGIAKAVGQSLTEKTIYTQFAQMIGTPLYMSPEQAEMSGVDVDTRADVYALGVLLYELLTGSTPFDRDRFRMAAFDEIRRIIREEEPPRPSTRLSSLGATLTAVSSSRRTEAGKLAGLIRGELDWIVMKCLEKDRNRRYDSATGLAKDVQRYLSGDAVEACPPTLGYRLRKTYRKNRAAIRVASAFVCLAFVAAVMGAGLAVQAKRAEKLAKDNLQLATENEEAARRAEADAVTERDKVAKSNAELERLAELQRRTRYAAEMNLLQAAYNASDMAQVRKLLQDQIPKPGGPDDLRGPEWHYWNRILNGHNREVTFRYQKPNEGNLIAHLPDGQDSYAISPEGNRIATSNTYYSGGYLNKVTIQLWDAESGLLLRETSLDVKTLYALEGLETHSFVEPSLRFSKNGQELVILNQLSFRVNNDLQEFEARHTFWDLNTHQLRTLEAPESRPTNETAGRNVEISDDFEYLCGTKRHFDLGRTGRSEIRVMRRKDQKELFHSSFLGEARARLAPDGKLLLLCDGPPPGLNAFLPLAATVNSKPTISYWKIGDPTPIWQRQLQQATGARSNNRRYLWPNNLHFRPDGTSYWEFDSEDGNCVKRTYSLISGELIKTTPTFHEADSNPLDIYSQFPENYWMIRGDGMQMASRNQRGLELVDLSEQKIPAWFARGRPANSIIRMDSLAGTPRQFRYRPDGSFVTLHCQDGMAMVRFWPPVESRPRQLAIPLDQTRRSPDESVFAVLVPEPQTLAAGGASPIPKQGRVVVFNSAGKQLLSIYCHGVNTTNNYNIISDFSTDGRYFVFVPLAGSPPGQPTKDESIQQVVIWDLQTQQPIARIRPEPGQTLLNAQLDPERPRLLLSLGHTSLMNKGGRADSSTVQALVYDFPGGRLLHELKLPSDVQIWRFFYRGKTIQGWIIPNSEESPYWDVRSGEYLGIKKRESQDDNGVSWEKETKCGSRVFRYHGAGTFNFDKQRRYLEIWDVARRGPGDRPLFTLEERTKHPDAHLSPDGKRLLRYEEPERERVMGTSEQTGSYVLYCTTTGRPLLALEGSRQTTSWEGDRHGLWSADSHQFWLGMHRDGRLIGYDFRPLPEPTK